MPFAKKYCIRPNTNLQECREPSPSARQIRDRQHAASPTLRREVSKARYNEYLRQSQHHCPRKVSGSCSPYHSTSPAERNPAVQTCCGGGMAYIPTPALRIRSEGIELRSAPSQPDCTAPLIVCQF